LPGPRVRRDGGRGKRLGARVAQIGWVLDHPRDLAADFRAIYHLDPEQAAALPGPEWFALAYRLPAYSGIMRTRVEQEDRNTNRNVKHGAKLIESERTSIEKDPLLADLIDFG
jgi:hypothetical protein